MYTESEGIVLKQIKTLNGRRMIVIFSEKFGKISAGTSINEKGKNRSALALRPFTYGRYEFFRGHDSISINAAEAKNSYYEIGEDVDRYMAASCALELTDRLLEEEQPSEHLFRLLKDYLELLSRRKGSYDTLLIGFRIKALIIMGCAPETRQCVRCSSKEDLVRFSVSEGGCLCRSCVGDSFPSATDFEADGLLPVFNYMSGHPLSALKDLALKDETEYRIKRILKSYYSYHLGIENLKSEGLNI